MNPPMYDIKDDLQLDYVIEAIERADYELAIARHRLLFLFLYPKDAYDAITHVRDLMQDFVRTGLGIIDGFESEDDE